MVYLFAFTSCESLTQEDKFTFEFNINDGYAFENSEEINETPNGFEDFSHQQYVLLFSNGQIDEVLETPCCTGPWKGYEIKPSTEVQIRFEKSKNELTSGIYTYEKGDTENDFFITIVEDIIFDENDEMTSNNFIAQGGSNSETSVENAQLKLTKDALKFEIKYRIETINNKILMGAYSGYLSSFSYNYCEADCD